MTNLQPQKSYYTDSETEVSDAEDYGVKQELYDEERQRIEEELKRHEEELKTLPYKVLVVGDAGIGKAKLLQNIRARAVSAGVDQQATNRNNMQSPVVKYVIQSQVEHVQFENITKPTILFEEGGDAGSNDTNPSSDPYKDADAVLLCFSVRNKVTLDNIEAKWNKTLRKSYQDLPTALVGLHGDPHLKDGSSGEGHQKIEVKPSQARKVSRKILSQAYIDLSGSVTKEDQVPKLLQQCASDARYGRLIRRRNLTGTQAREGDALPERIMLYTMGFFAAGPAAVIGGIATAQASGFGIKPLIRKARERSNRSKMAKTEP